VIDPLLLLSVTAETQVSRSTRSSRLQLKRRAHAALAFVETPLLRLKTKYNSCVWQRTRGSRFLRSV